MPTVEKHTKKGTNSALFILIYSKAPQVQYCTKATFSSMKVKQSSFVCERDRLLHYTFRGDEVSTYSYNIKIRIVRSISNKAIYRISVCCVFQNMSSLILLVLYIFDYSNQNLADFQHSQFARLLKFQLIHLKKMTLKNVFQMRYRISGKIFSTLIYHQNFVQYLTSTVSKF